MSGNTDQNAAREELLRSCRLFADLEATDRAEMGRLALTRHFDRHEALFHQGDVAEGFHVVMTGQVKICRYGMDGREQVLHVMGPGDPCGEVPVFQGQSYPANAVALDPVESLYFTRRDFLDLGTRRPGLLLNMMGVLAARLRHFVELVDDLSLKEVSSRLARHLLESGDAQAGDVVHLQTTKGVLASRLGTIAETLSRTLARLQRDELIRVDGKHVHLLDRPALERLAEGGTPS